jgi:hypothetical protein
MSVQLNHTSSPRAAFHGMEPPRNPHEEKAGNRNANAAPTPKLSTAAA